MADADYGYVGRSGGKISLYRKREEVRSGIPQERGVDELVALIRADGRWVDPPEGWTPPTAPVAFSDRIRVELTFEVEERADGYRTER